MRRLCKAADDLHCIEEDIMKFMGTAFELIPVGRAATCASRNQITQGEP